MLLPGREDKAGNPISGLFKAGSGGIRIQGCHMGIGYQQHSGSAVDKAAATARFPEKAGTDVDVVGAGCGGMKRQHGGTFLINGALFPEFFLDETALPDNGGNGLPVVRGDSGPRGLEPGDQAVQLLHEGIAVEREKRAP